MAYLEYMEFMVTGKNEFEYVASLTKKPSSVGTLVNHFPFLKQAPSTILNKPSTYGIVRTFEPDTRIIWKGDSCTHILSFFS